jgi:hypothetical protein
MRSSRVVYAFVFALCAVFGIPSLGAEHPANGNAAYHQLRDLMPGDDVVAVKDFALRRDAATFTFRSGSFAFYGPVNGRITGAVFRGDGHIHITPPIAAERHNLAIQTNSEEFDDDFDHAVLRFTDETANVIRKAATGKDVADGAFGRMAQEMASFVRDHDRLDMNLDLRLLEDVLNPVGGEFFLAGVHGKKNAHEFFVFDPLGVTWLAPEEVALLQWKGTDETLAYPLAFHRAEEYANDTASGNERKTPYHSDQEDLDVTIERNGFLTGEAKVKVTAELDGVAVIPLNLYPTLRVSGASDEKGNALDFIQEKKENDAEFGVVLRQPLKSGETTTLKIAYAGKDVVLNEGNGNYYPVARENWYPNASQGLGDYANYHMLFHVPKGLQLIATGVKLGESNDGGITTSEWKTDVPLPVVGFTLGDFAMKEAKVGDANPWQVTVDAYANKQPPNGFQTTIADAFESNSMERAVSPLGTLSTLPMLTPELSQGQAAVQVYSQYFGALPFNHIALTQQTACNYGQSWPMLVYLPICGFLDVTQQHALGLRPDDMYWKMVTPHEVAHQWWGQAVGFRGYRDQWMSEGFADASAAIYLQATRAQPDDFLAFWKEERRMLTEKNQFGFRPIDVGPVTMGYRLNSPKAGYSIARTLIYPKGAYILHMVRMMMWSPQDGDKRFEATMQDLIQSHKLQPATTEDFKAAIERHMGPAMNLGKNDKMDWFFDEYVYGTELPTYHFEGQTTPNDKGVSLHIKLVQSGVSDTFRMPVPIYLEYAKGGVLKLGAINITGNRTIDQTLQLPKLPDAVKKVSINHNYDVLALEN